jgi:hypothetical protein
MTWAQLVAIFLGVAALLILALALMAAAGRSSEQERRWEDEMWRRDVEARLKRGDEEDDGK